jgi:hypothetical protein
MRTLLPDEKLVSLQKRRGLLDGRLGTHACLEPLRFGLLPKRNFHKGYIEAENDIVQLREGLIDFTQKHKTYVNV